MELKELIFRLYELTRAKMLSGADIPKIEDEMFKVRNQIEKKTWLVVDIKLKRSNRY